MYVNGGLNGLGALSWQECQNYKNQMNRQIGECGVMANTSSYQPCVDDVINAYANERKECGSNWIVGKGGNGSNNNRWDVENTRRNQIPNLVTIRPSYNQAPIYSMPQNNVRTLAPAFAYAMNDGLFPNVDLSRMSQSEALVLLQQLAGKSGQFNGSDLDKWKKLQELALGTGSKPTEPIKPNSLTTNDYLLYGGGALAVGTVLYFVFKK